MCRLAPEDVAQTILSDLDAEQSQLIPCDDLVIACNADTWQGAGTCIDVLLTVLGPISHVHPLLLKLLEFSRVKFKDYVRLFKLVNEIKDGVTVKWKAQRMPDGKKPHNQDDRAVIGPNFVEVEVWRLGQGFKFDSWFAVLEEATFRSLKLHYVKRRSKSEISGIKPQPLKRDMAYILKPFLPFANNVSCLKEFALCWADLAVNDADKNKWRESRWTMPSVKNLYLKDVSVWNDGQVASPIIDVGAKEIETDITTSRNFLRLFTFPNLHRLKVFKYREDNPAVLSSLMEGITTLKLNHTRWPTLRPLLSQILPKTKIEVLQFSGVDFVEEFAEPLMGLKHLRTLEAEFNAQSNGRPCRPVTNKTVDESKQEEYTRGYNRNVASAAKRPGFNRRCKKFVKSLVQHSAQLSVFKFEAGHVYRKTAATRDEVIALQE